MRPIHRKQKIKYMKRIILTLALALTMSLAATGQTPRHRHNPQTVQASNLPDTAAAVAFSDTTATAADDENNASYTEDEDEKDRISVSILDVNDPFRLIAYLTTMSTGGVIIAIFFIILCIATIASPFIFIALIIYWAMHQKKRNTVWLRKP